MKGQVKYIKGRDVVRPLYIYNCKVYKGLGCCPTLIKNIYKRLWMTKRILDLHNLIIGYGENNVKIVFDKEGKAWFSGADFAAMLKYEDPQNAISNLIDPSQKKQLSTIDAEYKKIYKNAQPHTIYINEEGLNRLLMRSTKGEAKKLQYWIADVVMPQIRKTGKYVADVKLQRQLKKVRNDYENLRKRNRELENNQKKPNLPKGGYVYIIRPNPNSPEDLNRIGSTYDILKRYDGYNTSLPDNAYIVDIIQAKDYKKIEKCILYALRKYAYRGKKDYFKCSMKTIYHAIAACDDVGHIICSNCDKIVKAKSMSKHVNKHAGKRDSLYENQIIRFKYESYETAQKGGYKMNHNYEKYLKYKIRYLEMKHQIYYQVNGDEIIEV